MAQAIGYVTQLEDGNLKGVLTMMNMRNQIEIIANSQKTNDSQPDFRIYTENQTEIGGGWKRTGKNSGKEYISLSFAAPQFGPHKIYANLGRAAGQDDEDLMAIIWNPTQ